MALVEWPGDKGRLIRERSKGLESDGCLMGRETEGRFEEQGNGKRTIRA